jgi:hypothetical protein
MVTAHDGYVTTGMMFQFPHGALSLFSTTSLVHVPIIVGHVPLSLSLPRNLAFFVLFLRLENRCVRLSSLGVVQMVANSA